jgi:putative Mg2+ transporter-C (MgtC) family protein
MGIEWTEVLIRLGLAALLGGAIGLERERKDWAAGLRTHMMVCVGSSLTMMVSAFGFSDILGTPHVELDPSRVAAQVISGIGFIGAGTILFLKQGVIRGLTTASGLWTVAAIGLATGGGMYFAALAATIVALIILWVLQPFEKRISARFIQKGINIIANSQEKSTALVQSLLQRTEADILSCTITKNEDNDYLLSFKFKNISKQALADIISECQGTEGIKEINWNG